jgi:hypothetical protein
MIDSVFVPLSRTKTHFLAFVAAIALDCKPIHIGCESR